VHDQLLTANGTVGLKGKSPALKFSLNASNASIKTILAALDRKTFRQAAA